MIDFAELEEKEEKEGMESAGEPQPTPPATPGTEKPPAPEAPKLLAELEEKEGLEKEEKEGMESAGELQSTPPATPGTEKPPDHCSEAPKLLAETEAEVPVQEGEREEEPVAPPAKEIEEVHPAGQSPCPPVQPPESAEVACDGPPSKPSTPSATRRLQWQWAAVSDFLNKELGQFPAVQAVADNLQVTPAAVGAALAACAASFVLFGFGGQLIYTVLGVSYPAFESFKAVEAFANLADHENLYAKAAGLQFWLTYWIVVGVLASFELLLYHVLTWIPFYYPFKLLFLVWLFLPSTRGANVVYYWLVSPLLRRNRHSIDSALEDTSRRIEESGRRLRRNLTGSVRDAAASSLAASKDGFGSIYRSLVVLSAAQQFLSPPSSTMRFPLRPSVLRRSRTEPPPTAD